MQCGILPLTWREDENDNQKNWALLCTFRGTVFASYSVNPLDCIRKCNENRGTLILEKLSAVYVTTFFSVALFLQTNMFSS
jgi:hypothetical protein